MNYEKIYFNLVESYKQKESELLNSGIYLEQHHIKPKSLGGSNLHKNLVYLTPKAHFIAHICLHKFMRKRETAAAVNAMRMKTKLRGLNPNSYGYEFARKSHAEMISGEANPFYGKTHSDDQKEKWSKTRSGVKPSDEQRKKMSASQLKRDKSTYVGYSPTQEQREKRSQVLKKIISEKGHWRTGASMPEEWKKEHSKKMMGNKYAAGLVHTDETKNKISKANQGRKVSNETKALVSKALKGKAKSLECREKISKSLTGRKQSPEQALKHSEFMKKYHAEKRKLKEQ